MKYERGIKMNVSEVRDLNARIEKIQTQRTKIETKREMLMANLGTALKSYAETYGVDMRNSKLSVTKAAVEEEKSRVEGLIKQEFDLKSKVVAAIESGDIATAKKLLGVEDADEEPPVILSNDEEGLGDEEEFEAVTAEGMSAAGNEDDEDEVPWFEDEDSDEEDEDGNALIGKVAAGDTDWGDLSVEDSAEEPVVEATGKSFLEAVAKAEPTKKSGGVKDFSDEEDDLDDFGFGNITKGTKFAKG